MEWYVSLLGDHHPEAGRILLPVGVTLKDIYAEYITTYPNEDCITYAHFNRLWNESYRHVSYQRVSI